MDEDTTPPPSPEWEWSTDDRRRLVRRFRHDLYVFLRAIEDLTPEDIKRQAGRDTIRVYLYSIQAFRFQKYLVPHFFRKTHHLVFNGRTIAGSNPLNNTSIHG